ncbi:hypothetical protein G0Q06_02560 [Puniceicoccales bacterium CK1056]|uniref:BioF2-like acetyltransferase domain-containing protein n=1 Tax=Oceanipulchritudo coccoides TaxID=2706888 RepID=A0A6B2LZ54_9BACT|nr:hypothetical protein [Oceanipulchritudo coccoides]NDV61329.1 hypothetical protein [Oceanipulchritudo coccoides]
MSTRRFKSEGPVLYNRYQFGYCEWLESTTGQNLKEAYEGGFLPYSADLSDPRHLFYMARSLRVDLGEFKVEKNRRYDHREWQACHLVRKHVPKDQFLAQYGDHAVQKAGLWMEQRFGKPYLSENRLEYILRKPFLRDILTWEDGTGLRAFALIVLEDWGAHYWYIFYANDAGKNDPPGQGYLVDFLNWASGKQLPCAYLGTAYGQKSLYKSRGIQGIEFWDGNEWSSDKGKLMRYQEADEQSQDQPC